MIRGYMTALCKFIGQTTPYPLYGCEVGVWKGSLSSMLLRQFPQLCLFAVDPWNLGGNHTTMSRATPQKIVLAKQSFIHNTKFVADRCVVIQMESVKAAELVRDDFLDFVFIDACHLYEYVRQDLIAWWPKVKKGGLFAGHDYSNARKEFPGVKKAVDKFAVEIQRKIIIGRSTRIWHCTK